MLENNKANRNTANENKKYSIQNGVLNLKLKLPKENERFKSKDTIGSNISRLKTQDNSPENLAKMEFDRDKYKYSFSPNMHFKKGINNNNLLDFRIELKSKKKFIIKYIILLR